MVESESISLVLFHFIPYHHLRTIHIFRERDSTELLLTAG
jgi:hypothetical protein